MKKQGSLFQECEDIYYKNIEEKNLSQKLAHYVWDVLLRVQRGYSFNRSHCLAYSLIALQEMNLCYKYPIIYWNAACLITDSGSEDSGTDYDKVANAIGKMRSAGVKIELPEINTSQYGFEPKEESNSIYCGFKSITNVGTDVVNAIIENRPYSSVKEFVAKVHPNKQAMISLIKSGAFDNLMDRRDCMIWYIWETCDKKKKITLQNMAGLIKYNLLPEDTPYKVEARRVYEFNRYLKAACKNDSISYKLDIRAINFLNEICYDELIYNNCYINIKEWNKIYDNYMNVFRDWITEDKDKILENLNTLIFKEDWDKYAKGTISAWEMEALCFYYHEHELLHIDKLRYGIKDFDKLSSSPEVDYTFRRNGKDINIFKLNRICGTCIAKNKAKGSISLLTTSGVVNVSMPKEYFAMFDKQISQRQADGTKKVIEKSWFNRGSMLIVQGIRQEDGFRLKNYKNSGSHQLYKIDKVNDDGSIVLRSERYQGDAEDE